MKDSGKLILALDVDNGRKAKYFINKLYPQIKVFKIGSQLFTACGPEIIKFVINKKAEVFLDLKFFDIPNTVACAVRQAVRLGVLMFTLHISGQEEMVRAAVSAAKEEAKKLKIRKPKVIGVTVLTSQEVSPDEILRLAKSGLKWGLDGVVCSARETGLLRKKLGKKFIIVTPGIRPRLSGKDDQKRVATAKESLRSGSSFLVVGRPILEAKDPLRAAKEIF
ncbi:orotidine-5'-phosphate decarboxylase [bacterium]|nr:MAG: orotidine-5'-phosphate decarboxylase [bacterium]